jgi:tetratricopeptide (TPR) repeat protein
MTNSAADAALLHNRQGIALARQGRFEESAASFREALRLQPGYADALSNLGNVLTFLGRLDEARTCYEQAAQVRPQDAALLNNLSNLLRIQGDREGAVERARAALALQPDYAEAHNNLGSALMMLRRPAEAADCFRQALALAPNLVEAYSNLGDTLRQLGRFDDAVACCRHAVALAPGFARAQHHLGTALASRGELDEALAALCTALRIDPNLPEARADLADVLRRLGRLDEAMTCCLEVLALKPDLGHGHNMLGLVLTAQARPAEAMPHFDRALELQPDVPEFHLHRGLALLVQGNFPEGLREYEWRRRCTNLGLRQLPEPAWDGSSFVGRTLLLHAEQGLGDTVQCLRLAPRVKERGGTVLFRGPPPFLPLLERCPGIDGVVTGDPVRPGIDLHASLLSLPYLLGLTLDTIPAEVPYLFPARERIADWRGRLAELPGLKVGLVWQGNPRHSEDRLRSIPLAEFEPLAHVPGVALLSLQVGPGSEQMAGCRFPIQDFASQLDPTPGAVLDAAAVLCNLDLLISCDTGLAHLSGALGVSVWLAVPFAPDWRWLLGRDDSPWYPTMRLLRAPAPAVWGPVIRRMADALRGFTSPRERSA